MKKSCLSEKITSAIYGVAVGDALGNPVQFLPREDLQANPLTEMIGGGVFNKKPGTWTDDTSMTLCLLASLADRGTLDYEDVMDNFIDWLCNSAFTPNEKTFDVGQACFRSIITGRRGVPPLECGRKGEHENGNGSLMRIAPIVFYLYKEMGGDAFSKDEAFKVVENVSALTHAHPIALVGCDIYVAMLMELLQGCKKEELRDKALPKVLNYVERHPEYKPALERYSRIMPSAPKDLTELQTDEINSSGYVVDTLESALWSFLTTDSYKECLLKAVNLAGDSDSIGAVVGGMAGLYYCGDEERKIPQEWMEKVRGKKLINSLLDKFCATFGSEETV